MQSTPLVLLLALAMPALVHPSQSPEPPKDAAAQQAPAQHHDAVQSRGDHAMGFSHDTSTHHFRLYKTGGAIEVLANDPADTSTRDQIRMHLSHITKLFSAGDFNIPMFIHSTTPPGAPTMTKLREQIRYQLQETPRGAKIQITTTNPQALDAIHAFLRFQISDHQTADTPDVTTPM
jgi:TusA-related sulfurtransferase